MQVSGQALNSEKVIELTRNDRRRVIEQQKKNSESVKPKRFDETVTIIDILGDDAIIRVEVGGNGSSSAQRDYRFSNDLWEVYGESLHFNQKLRIYGVETKPTEPITVLELSSGTVSE